jgi:hypothetical protein
VLLSTSKAALAWVLAKVTPTPAPPPPPTPTSILDAIEAEYPETSAERVLLGAKLVVATGKAEAALNQVTQQGTTPDE